MIPIRVAIFDDHTILRDGIRLLIEQHPDMKVVGEGADWNEALRLVRDVSPDVVTVDLSMPGGPPFDRMRQLSKASSSTRILVLTMHSDVAYIRAAIAAGAAGFASKATAGEELIAAIRKVYSGELYTPAKCLASDNGTTPTSVPCTEDFVSLSPREREVLKGAASGLTNREMASLLLLSVKTIESYRARLVSKLGLKGRTDLIQYALRHGLLDR